MSQIKIHETKLPGVGVQHDFETEEGPRVGVITHHTGRRDFLLFAKNDPDRCSSATTFTEQESQLLGELLGASQVVQTIGNIQQTIIGGLALDWIVVHQDWSCVSATLSSLKIAEAGVQVVAIIRNESTIPDPSPNTILQSDDVILVVGKPDKIRVVSDTLHGEVN